MLGSHPSAPTLSRSWPVTRIAAGGRPVRYHNGAAGLGHTSREEKRMTKADLVEQVADAIGPRVTKRECGLAVDTFLDAVKRTRARRPHRTPGVRHLQGAEPQGPHGPQPQDRRGSRGSGPRCAGLQTFNPHAQSSGPSRWRVRNEEPPRAVCGRWSDRPGHDAADRRVSGNSSRPNMSLSEV